MDLAHIQDQALVRVLLGDADKGRANPDLDAELFVQLADQRRFGRFVGLDLTARKFPQAGQVAALGAPRQQDAAEGVADDAGNDVDVSGFFRQKASCRIRPVSGITPAARGNA